MSILTFILGLVIGFIAGKGLWRKYLAKFGAWATATSNSSTFSRMFSVHPNAREKKE